MRVREAVIAATLVTASVMQGQTPVPAGGPTKNVKQWQLRVPVDSGEVEVDVHEKAASVTVISPTGTFVKVFDTAQPLSEWADVLETLPGPETVRDSTNTAGAPPKLRYLAATLGETHTSAFDNTSFRLIRLDTTSLPSYLFTGTNGGWTFSLSIDAGQMAALLGALRGDSTSGTFRFEYPQGSTTGPGKPTVTGAWLEFQVDKPAWPGKRQPHPAYPKELTGSGTSTVVRMQFIVDSTGHVQPSSVRLIGTVHPAFAIAVRKALLDAEYIPATIAGKPVPQLFNQAFEFRP